MEEKVIALAGNPNVGKSTLFNSLTGGRQHTGNWIGKTVSNARGYLKTASGKYILVDIPGTYSLMAHSSEEEIARNFLCFGGIDAAVVVCDATCLERNLNLVLQTMEVCSRVLVCVNLLDEAEKKHIHVSIEKLSELLGIPAAGIVARKKKTLKQFTSVLDEMCRPEAPKAHFLPAYCDAVENAVSLILPAVREKIRGRLPARWLSLKLLEGDPSLLRELESFLGENILEDPSIEYSLAQAGRELAEQGISQEKFKDLIVTGLVECAEKIAAETVNTDYPDYNERDRRLDRIFTSRVTGYPVMIGLLALIFWLTITGANYPSRLLSDLLFSIQDQLTAVFTAAGAPSWLHGMVVLGIYRSLAWIISVMLPPMAIFFPLFTLLEDSGYLPRIAFNLDKPFQCCQACGKQALTMAMGFGCNAAGVTGCRIIDSPRERLIAILTNSFVPCNGRFPTLIALISMFLVVMPEGPLSSLTSSLMLTLFILLGITMTFFASRLLSATILKGVPSSFTLELPPYRRPQIGKVIIRSVFDRTLFVLGRAACVAAPAGLVIWLVANISVGSGSLLSHCARFFDPFARLLGLDGVILTAFLLGLPANEIVMPIILMAYTAQGSLMDFSSLTELRQLLTANGWTWITAVCTILFSLMHWPCSTTLLTIHKETGSWKWTLIAFLLPTLFGMALCFLFAQTAGQLL